MSALSPAAVEVLRGAVADARTIRLPVMLDRRTYMEVDRALSRIAGGGRWDRRAGAHVFSRDPRPDLERLTGAPALPPPLASRDKALSYWATPAALAALLVDGLGPQPDGAVVLEPSAGCGSLVRAVRAAWPGAHIDAVEVDPTRAKLLERHLDDDPAATVFPGSFEQHAGLIGGAPAYDLVAMNPPFTLPGDRYAWAAHVELAWSLLKRGGQLRAIVPASLGFSRVRRIAAVRDLIRAAGGTWTPAPAGSFRPAGTDVHTLIVEATR